MRTIVVVDYDPAWPELFEQIRSCVWPAIRDVALSVEHVGSTSVPGLAAKPIIDMTVVVSTPVEVPLAIERLATVGYAHRGDLGIAGREAFERPARSPHHHLYLCVAGSQSLENHVLLRDYLRAHPALASEYGELKKQLAQRFPHDIDAYMAGKAPAISRILRAARR
jgi:GrpB-like predicted nucleotidyltransferase (UPF0157 family)